MLIQCVWRNWWEISFVQINIWDNLEEKAWFCIWLLFVYGFRVLLIDILFLECWAWSRKWENTCLMQAFDFFSTSSTPCYAIKARGLETNLNTEDVNKIHFGLQKPPKSKWASFTWQKSFSMLPVYVNPSTNKNLFQLRIVFAKLDIRYINNFRKV